MISMFRKIHIYFTIIIAYTFVVVFIDSTLRSKLIASNKVQQKTKQAKVQKQRESATTLLISSELKKDLDDLIRNSAQQKSDQYENKIQSYARHLENDEIDQLSEIVLSKNISLELRQISKEILDRNQSDYAEKKRAEIEFNQGIE